MTDTVEFIARAAVVGAGATLVMDLWAALLGRLGVPSLDLALLGRWVGHLARQRWTHRSIGGATPIPGERWIGWSAHYAIGISFAALHLWTFGLDWGRSPTLAPALTIGLVTVAAPWFILQPSMGAGVASSKTPRPVVNSLKSLVTHAVFGVGMYLAARTAAWLVPFPR